MSTGSDKPSGREVAIRNARLRLIQLEIESHRVKAELARLEASRQDEAADRLVKGMPAVDVGDASPSSWKRVVPDSEFGLTDELLAWAGNVVVKKPMSTESPDLVPSESSKQKDKPHQVAPTRQKQLDRTQRRVGALESTGQQRPNPKLRLQGPRAKPHAKQQRKSRRLPKGLRSAPAWLLSIVFHVVVLVLFGLLTMVSLQKETVPILASSINAGEALVEEPAEIEFDQSELEEADLEEMVSEGNLLEMSNLDPGGFSDLAETAGGNTGLESEMVDPLAGDIGSLMAVTGNGEPGGDERHGGTRFFGTVAKGERFVFVVDNSGSMQEGRIETAFLQLISSVELMRPEQEFFVIFYSDRAYPLFYPDSADHLVPATRENVKRLKVWLASVELCSGGDLVEAIELAIELRPDVVFMLSDGAINSQRTMNFMTDPNSWTFAVHTFGMNVKGPEQARKLGVIAQANRGTFQLVQPSLAAIQLSKQRPVRYNKRGATWGENGR
jgi:hypothetical protein